MKKISLIFFFAFLALVISCAKPEGEFAFKLPGDQGYRRVEGLPEFNANDEVGWIYSFASIRGRLEMGVILLRKELLWVDVLSYSDYADGEKMRLYGTIKGLEPGDYRLMITEITEEEQKVLDEIEFYVFSDDEAY